MPDQQTPTSPHDHESDSDFDAVNAGAEAIHRGIDMAKEGATAAASLATQTKQRIKAGAHAVDGAVHSHPYGALAVGAGLGILVGVLLRRCRCHR